MRTTLRTSNVSDSEWDLRSLQTLRIKDSDSASIHKLGLAHMLLRTVETGLRMDYAVRADNIAIVLRANLREPEPGQRSLSHTTICKLCALVKIAMDCPEAAETASSEVRR
jgi:hypothetical protein